MLMSDIQDYIDELQYNYEQGIRLDHNDAEKLYAICIDLLSRIEELKDGSSSISDN